MLDTLENTTKSNRSLKIEQMGFDFGMRPAIRARFPHTVDQNHVTMTNASFPCTADEALTRPVKECKDFWLFADCCQSKKIRINYFSRQYGDVPLKDLVTRLSCACCARKYPHICIDNAPSGTADARRLTLIERSALN